ncbi:hypothetical protein DFJ58DRAFT_39835 [Suillus subalutaceus]|uniref:uncharacterized protein n=1 Tax=Suillus subalutaceus TaxID=48586 RepID=UPI001B86292B|nr:uncharacterized protein DFJ58DRAFT_39835 [Suillus subalutaceus]KAG1870093.1 hypothetical protein DFJ58DRAFT_39835 [Suillus subalutaceus]
MTSAGIVNICRDVDVKFYRYRMPLKSRAKAMTSKLSSLTWRISCELGAQTPFNDKNERYIIVNGAHHASGSRLTSSSTNLCSVVHAGSLRWTFSSSKWSHRGCCQGL